MNLQTNYRDYAALAGRMGLAAIFLISGFGKLMSPEMTQSYIAAAGLPMPQVGYWLAVAIELLGGAALVLGLSTRAVAIGLAVFTMVAAFGFHANFADQGQMIQFLKNVAISGGLLQVVAFGGGAITLQKAIFRKPLTTAA